jgi:GTP cyclohydrolase II/3,4-dihydroxy 2-butanone 4-phosphate synthase/GTP cyclohydrolase II
MDAMTPERPHVIRYAEADIPTHAGPLRLIVYRLGQEGAAPAEALPSPAPAGERQGQPEEHMAIVSGDVRGEGVLARVHSECWTGETLGSLKCDCREQLDRALEAIVEAGRGVVVYLRQEGRGIGLGNKIRAYALQNQGADTVEANTQLGFAADLRSYGLAAAILADLGVTSVALMTNNPDKEAGLEAAGVRVAERIPHWVGHHEHNRDYLEVKRSKLGHRE